MHEAPLGVRDRHAQDRARPGCARVHGVGLPSTSRCTSRHSKCSDALRVSAPSSRPGLAGDLEAVADGEHRPALFGERLDRAHDRRVRGHRAGAQVIAVGKAAGQDHRVGVAERAVLVPGEARRARPCTRADDVEGVVVAVASREIGRPRCSCDAARYRYSSMTVLASSFSHICFERARRRRRRRRRAPARCTCRCARP